MEHQKHSSEIVVAVCVARFSFLLVWRVFWSAMLCFVCVLGFQLQDLRFEVILGWALWLRRGWDPEV